MRRPKFGVIALLFFCSLTASFFNISTAHAFSGAGAGTGLNPYKITTCGQLQEIDSNKSATYAITNSIDCAGVSFTPIGGTGGGFTGTLDGGSHTISNLTITQTSGDHIGLFAFLEGGTVSNLTIDHATMTGGSYVGMLAGGTNGFGSIQHVYVTNSHASGSGFIGGIFGSMFQFSSADSGISNTNIEGNSDAGTASQIGGFAGEITVSDVARSYVKGGTVNGNPGDPTSSQYVGGFDGDDGNGTNIWDSFSTATVIGHVHVGGFSGSLNDTVVTTSYAAGSVTGDTNVGGFTGELHGATLDHSFSAGAVTGNFTVGGLVGDTSSLYGGTLSASAWDKTRSGQANCVGNLEITIDCTGVNVSGAAPNYFFNNHTNAPLNAWDFTTAWRTNATDYPSFPTVPGQVSSVQISRSATTLQFSWDAPDTGGRAITSYEIRWGVYGGSLTNATVSAATLNYTLSNLSPSTRYTFEIRVTNNLGAGDWSTYSAFTLDQTASSTSGSAAKTIAAVLGETATNPGDEPTSTTETSQTTTTPTTTATNEPANDAADTPKGPDLIWYFIIPGGGILLVWLGVVIVGKLRA